MVKPKQAFNPLHPVLAHEFECQGHLDGMSLWSACSWYLIWMQWENFCGDIKGFGGVFMRWMAVLVHASEWHDGHDDMSCLYSCSITVWPFLVTRPHFRGGVSPILAGK